MAYRIEPFAGLVRRGNEVARNDWGFGTLVGFPDVFQDGMDGAGEPGRGPPDGLGQTVGVTARRSCLVLPATNRRMAERAAASAADQVILDLEDAVAPADKPGARAAAVEALRTNDFGGKVRSVRINAVDTPWCEGDLEALHDTAVDVVVLPKVQDAEQVRFVEERLPPATGIDVLIESARGAVDVREISRASERIDALVFGAGDYAASLGIGQVRIGGIDPRYPGNQWQWVMSELAACAHAVGAQVIDTAYADFGDEAGYCEAALRAKLLGFTGKWCIHPNQVPWANRVFTPTAEEIEAARRIVAAYDGGAVVLDGTMVDEASRKLAEATLARAQTSTSSR